MITHCWAVGTMITQTVLFFFPGWSQKTNEIRGLYGNKIEAAIWCDA